MTYLDVWRSGTFLLYSCKAKAAFWIQETSPRLSDVECSVVLWSVFAIGSTLTYLLFSGNVPLLHTSRYVIARDSVYQAFPTLVLQATNAGARKPWYEAISSHLHIMLVSLGPIADISVMRLSASGCHFWQCPLEIICTCYFFIKNKGEVTGEVSGRQQRCTVACGGVEASACWRSTTETPGCWGKLMNL